MTLAVGSEMRCPLCRRETVWEDNPWRPFCSERCQLIDLGRWASEDYRIPQMEGDDANAPTRDTNLEVDDDQQ
jgi:endogenous inhibitor of DNA gyrase (YacG/DUF329 family)